ncbi:uncharacterized protein TNCV_656621 [Trichonephila clavipes]|nr:uncharacterized protein TNCV_656621 [Trichonephila clavipes]
MLTAVPLGLGLNPGEGMDVYKCIVPLRHGATLNCHRAASPLVRLVERKERWKALDPFQVGENCDKSTRRANNAPGGRCGQTNARTWSSDGALKKPARMQISQSTPGVAAADLACFLSGLRENTLGGGQGPPTSLPFSLTSREDTWLYSDGRDFTYPDKQTCIACRAVQKVTAEMRYECIKCSFLIDECWNTEFYSDVRTYLNATFGVRWIGPVPWTPRPPDLWSLDSFLWGHLKDLIYVIPLVSDEDLVARISEVAACVPEIHSIFEHVLQSFHRCY